MKEQVNVSLYRAVCVRAVDPTRYGRLDNLHSWCRQNLCSLVEMEMRKMVKGRGGNGRNQVFLFGIQGR